VKPQGHGSILAAVPAAATIAVTAAVTAATSLAADLPAAAATSGNRTQSCCQEPSQLMSPGRSTDQIRVQEVDACDRRWYALPLHQCVSG
jgi:hypothetical protein